MTKEDYNEILIRMWDENRDSKCKGLPNCAGVKCEDCILNKVLCQPDFGDTELHNVFDVLELIEQWGKEHPIKTNAEKFEEVFGVDAPMNRCIKNYEFCVDCEFYEFSSEHGGCKADERFWDAEYKPRREVQRNERND